MNEGNETLRWPTNLDRAGIEARLAHVRADAEAAGLAELAAKLSGLETLDAKSLGARVIAAIGMVQEKPEHDALATQLAMVAMNLKNLKE